MRAGKREAIKLTDEKQDNINYTLDHSESGLPEDTDSSHPLEAGAPVRPDSPTFADLGVHPEIVVALHEAGIEHTFAIQELTLPLALAGEDLIGQARTGMGKTLGFGIPLLQRITLDGAPNTPPQALVVVPTRELCLQVSHDLTDAGRKLGARVLAVYGGRPYAEQTAALLRGVDVVVGTPGRLLDLAEQRHLVLGKVKVLVLDEADEMLDLGFLPDVERILRMVPEQRQTMLFSATMPGPIVTLARTFLHQPTHIRAEETDAGAIHELTAQFVYRAHALDKLELVARVLQARHRGLTMIFARTKRTAQKIADDLGERGFAAASVHGDLSQGAREQALRAFRTGKVDVLVATDVAARGIDIEDVTHVINYQCPEDEKTYVHRIGRTGRAGRPGVAITLVDWDEVDRWRAVDQALNLGMPEPMETYSTSAHLYAEFGIPADATGELPIAHRTRAGLAAEPEEDLGGRRPRRRRPGAATAVTGDGEERQARRARRPRRRTRAGKPVGGEAEQQAVTSDPRAGAEERAEQEQANAGARSDQERPGGPTRRRRRRRSEVHGEPQQAAPAQTPHKERTPAAASGPASGPTSSTTAHAGNAAG